MLHAVAMLFILAFAAQAHAQTRLYIDNLPETFNPAPQGSWHDTTPNLSALHFPCRTTKAGALTSVGNTEESTLSGYRVLILSCVSDPLATDQPLGGPGTSVRWVLGAAEANSIQDNYWRAHIWVARGSTGEVRGTLVNAYEENPASAPGNEWPAVHGKGWSNFGTNVALTSTPVDARAGDRVVIEIGATMHQNSGARYTSTLWIGGTDAADLQLGGDELKAQGWFQLSQSIAFDTPPIVTPTTPAVGDTPTPTATAASTATPSATSTAASTATPSATSTAAPSTPTPSVTSTAPSTPTPSATSTMPPGGPHLVVNSILDQPDGFADNVCSTDPSGAGPCTLRAAVETGNQLQQPATISIPPGVYEIGLSQFAVTGDLRIQGTGSAPSAVVIKLIGKTTARAFAVIAGGSLTLENLTIFDYRNELYAALEGACLSNAGTLVLDNVVLDHCDNARSLSTPPFAKGGGVYNAGTLLTRNGTRFDTGISNWGACLFNAKNATANFSDTTFLNCHTLGLEDEEPENGDDAAGGGAGIFNVGTVNAVRTSFIYCRARLGLGGGAILNGDRLGDEGLGVGGTVNLTNVTFSRNRCRRCEGGAFTSYGGTINAKLTTVNATQSAFLSGIVLRDNAVLNADRMIIEGHNISVPSSGFDMCFTANGAQVNVVGPAPSMDDSLDITPPRNTCPGFTPAQLCLLSDGDYGGLVETVRLNTSSSCRSAAIDAGGATCDEVEDARGFPRPVGAGCDLGSFEVQP